jgi:3-hydroxyisobutyrate dehydrogenase
MSTPALPTSPLADTPHDPPRARVGIIGVGSFGAAVAERLLGLGYQVAVHDRDPQREEQAVTLGAMACVTPTGVAQASDVLVLTVGDAAQTHEALFGTHGAASSLRAGGAVMLCAGMSPGEVEQIAAALQPRDVDCLDAPLAGSAERARDGSIGLMLACPQETLERHRRLIGDLSSHVFVVSERVGDATRTQLVNALLAGINLAAAAEALALAEKLGLNLSRTLEVIEQSSGQSWIANDRLHRALRGDYLPRSRTALMQRDTALALAMAQEAGADAPFGALAAQLYARAAQSGLAAMDDAAVLELLRRRR